MKTINKTSTVTTVDDARVSMLKIEYSEHITKKTDGVKTSGVERFTLILNAPVNGARYVHVLPGSPAFDVLLNSKPKKGLEDALALLFPTATIGDIPTVDEPVEIPDDEVVTPESVYDTVPMEVIKK
jgi:hypothetical protein